MAQYFGMSPEEVVAIERLPEFKTELSKDWLHNEIYDSKSQQMKEAYQRKLKIDSVSQTPQRIQKNMPLIEGRTLVSHRTVTDLLKLHALKKL